MLEPSRRSFAATTHSAVSIVNAIPAGKGSAITIDIPCTVKASILPREAGENIVVQSQTEDPHGLVKKTVRYSLSHLGAKIPRSKLLRLQIKSQIPTAVGLKSSSAVSVASAKAVFGLFSREADYWSILRTSCKASKDSRASLTGAYDDASASLLGGLVFTDNSRFRLIKHSRAPSELGSRVAILVPVNAKMLTSSVKASSYARYRKDSLAAFDYALHGDYVSAMMLNSIIQCAALQYSIEPVTLALAQGASAVGITGKGPAVAALCQDSKTLRRVKTAWMEKRNCRVIETTIVQPTKIFR
jgi:shikimate kinase